MKVITDSSYLVDAPIAQVRAAIVGGRAKIRLHQMSNNHDAFEWDWRNFGAQAHGIALLEPDGSRTRIIGMAWGSTSLGPAVAGNEHWQRGMRAVLKTLMGRIVHSVRRSVGARSEPGRGGIAA